MDLHAMLTIYMIVKKKKSSCKFWCWVWSIVLIIPMMTSLNGDINHSTLPVYTKKYSCVPVLFVYFSEKSACNIVFQ